MPIVRDIGNWRNQLNSKVADIIANIFGQRVNYLLRYYSHRHKFPRFKNPQNLSERILSAMLQKDFLKYAIYADKVRVREYVTSKGLGNILLEQFGVWNNATDINFALLPDKFILKANNGCGGHVICTDKHLLDISATIVQMNNALLDVKRLRNTEPHYCAINPKILCEELMGDGKTLPIDYKFFCINGHVECVLITCNRENGTKLCTMDRNWSLLPYIYEHKMPNIIPSKPANFSEMIEIAERLSEDFEFVRVDLYSYHNKTIFGELTFSPQGGILSNFTIESLEYLGSRFKI